MNLGKWQPLESLDDWLASSKIISGPTADVYFNFELIWKIYGKGSVSENGFEARTCFFAKIVPQINKRNQADFF